MEYTFVLYIVNVHNKRLKRALTEHEIDEAVSKKPNKIVQLCVSRVQRSIHLTLPDYC